HDGSSWTAENGRTASVPPRYGGTPGGATEMRRAAAPARRPPLRARRPATRKPKPGADAPGLAGRDEWPSHSTRDLDFTLPSGARYHAIREQGMDQAQHDERRMARAEPRAQRDRTRVSERATEPGFEVVAVAARQ